MERTSAQKISTIIILAMLIVGTAAVSYFVLSSQSLRLDEAQSLWQTSYSVRTMLWLVAGDVHVPLYHLLLHYWQLFLGNDIAMVRMLSLLFFLLTIPLIYEIGLITYGHKVGLYAATLTAVSPFLNWYGNEARMYSLLLFLTVLSQYLFIRIYKSDGNRAHLWVLYGATCVIGVFTHYFFLLNFAGQIIFFLANRKLFQKTALRNFILVASIIVLLIAGWLYYVYEVGQVSYARPLLSAPTSIDLFNVLSQFIFGFQDDHINTEIVSFWPMAMLLAFMILNKKAAFLKEDTLLFVLAAALPLIGAFVFSITFEPVFLSRYLIICVPALYILLSWMLSMYSPVISSTLKASLIVLMLVMFFNEVARADTPVRENYRGAVDYLNANVKPSDEVIVSAPFTIYPVEYYYRGDADLTTMPSWNILAHGPIPSFSNDSMTAQISEIKQNHRRVWLLLSYDQGYEPEIKSYFDSNFSPEIISRNFSPGLDLYLYSVKADSSDIYGSGAEAQLTADAQMVYF